MTRGTTSARICFALLIAWLIAGPAVADEISLGAFPRGKWLDAKWKAYWTFVDDDIRLLDVRDEPIYEFKGIVQNMRTERTASSVVLTFECAQAKRSYRFEKPDTGNQLLMNIRQWGDYPPYEVDMPSISDKELVVYKQIVIEAEEAAVTAVKTETPEAVAARTLAEVLAAAEKADFALMDELSLQSLADGSVDAVIAALEAEAAKPNAPPAVHVALSALYGRKGLKTREYAAIAAAESAVKPGMAYNVALLYGRKKLLAGASDADSFMIGTVEVTSEPAGAKVFLDGREMGTSPMTLESVRAGSRKVRLELAGHEAGEAAVELAVGGRATASLLLRALPPVKPAEPPAAGTASVVLPWYQNGYLVSMDGKPVQSVPGANPFGIAGVAPGKRLLTVAVPEIGMYSRELELKAGESFTVMKPMAFYGGKILDEYNEVQKKLGESQGAIDNGWTFLISGLVTCGLAGVLAVLPGGSSSGDVGSSTMSSVTGILAPAYAGLGGIYVLIGGVTLLGAGNPETYRLRSEALAAQLDALHAEVAR